MMYRYIILSISWIAFCALHSALISVTAARFVETHLKPMRRWYRILYNTIAAFTLAPVVIYTRSFSDGYFFTWSGYFAPVRYCMLGCAVLLIILALREYDWLYFAGIRQAMNKGGESSAISERGILGVMRHPLYVSVFLLLWAGDLNPAALIVNVILSVYLVAGTMLEERKLILEYGEDYLRYMERVPMYLPRMRLHR